MQGIPAQLPNAIIWRCLRKQAHCVCGITNTMLALQALVVIACLGNVVFGAVFSVILPCKSRWKQGQGIFPFAPRELAVEWIFPENAPIIPCVSRARYCVWHGLRSLFLLVHSANPLYTYCPHAFQIAGTPAIGVNHTRPSREGQCGGAAAPAPCWGR